MEFIEEKSKITASRKKKEETTTQQIKEKKERKENDETPNMFHFEEGTGDPAADTCGSVTSPGRNGALACVIRRHHIRTGHVQWIINTSKICFFPFLSLSLSLKESWKNPRRIGKINAYG